MVLTPWGVAEELRERRLPPGAATPREEVVRNQRERLFAALVATVAEKGYEATSVADLVELSGVSRSAFYEHFADKQDCFAAALEAIVAMAIGYAARRTEKPGASWEERARRAADAFARLIVAQPAAARLCLVETYAAGPEVLGRLETAIGGFEKLTAQVLAASPKHAGMPPEMIRSLLGTMQEIGRTRLRRGAEAELPGLMDELWELMRGYRPPPRALRLAERTPSPAPESLDGHDRAERALRAFAAVVAERGYSATTVGEVVGRAQMSAATFYSHFAGKADALEAALDSGGAQLVAAVLPAARRAPDWPHGIRAAFGALFSYLASRPALARLIAVEVYAAGPEAVERRAEAVRPLEGLLAEGYDLSPTTPAIAVEAIVGGAYTLTYRQIREAGPESLPALAPICTYIALAPFIGAEEACEVARGDGRGRRGRAGATA